MANWRNSRFQVRYFLVGKCHTLDAAYHMAVELHEERDVTIRSCAAAELRIQAKAARAQAVLSRFWSSKSARLEAEADLAEIEAGRGQAQKCYAEALREREYLDEIIEELRDHPARTHRNLPDHEAFQACQQEEWRLELIHRAETFLFTASTIPQDHYSTMMSHPEYKVAIAPVIDRIVGEAKLGKLTLKSMTPSAKLLLLGDSHGV